MDSKKVSVRFEISVMRNAIEAARLLVGNIELGLHQSDHDRRVAPHAIAAVLALTSERAGRLMHVLGGGIDPADILSPENEIEAGGEAEADEDLFLRPWSARRRLNQAKITIRRAKADLAERGKKT